MEEIKLKIRQSIRSTLYKYGLSDEIYRKIQNELIIKIEEIL